MLVAWTLNNEYVYLLSYSWHESSRSTRKNWSRNDSCRYFLTLMHALHDMTRCPRYDEEKDVPKVHRRQAAAARGTRCKSAWGTIPNWEVGDHKVPMSYMFARRIMPCTMYTLVVSHKSQRDHRNVLSVGGNPLDLVSLLSRDGNKF